MICLNKLAILGPGLLGGSLALAAAKSRLASRIHLWARRPERCRAALEHGLSPEVSTDLAEVVTGADLVILATPIGAMAELAHKIKPLLEPEAAITDVGSVKGPVVAELEAVLGENFVGSHPMAGNEKTGLEHASATLFDRACCIVTPTGATRPSATARVNAFWKQLGCRVQTMSPEAHDRAVGLVSHLPHLVAAAMVNAVIEAGGRSAFQLVGPGFRDSTRVALGSPEMWAEIFAENRGATLEAVAALRQQLDVAEAILREEKSLTEYLAAAKVGREEAAPPR